MLSSAKDSLWNDIRHGLWSKYIMHKVCSEIYATRWCYNLWCANGPGSLGNVLLAPQPRFRDLALPSIKYWNQFFHIPTHFNGTRMQINHFNYSGSVNPALAQPHSHYIDDALTVCCPVSCCLSISSNCHFW